MHQKILHFWQWFTHNEAVFRNEHTAEKAKEMLDNQVLSFGKFAWGIDIGLQKSFSFTFSPNNDPKLLALSKQIVAAAPNLPLWEFYYCRPAEKDWDFQFQMLNNLIVPQTFDASEWSFVLIEEDDYRVTIEIKADNLDTLDMDDKITAMSRAVNRLIGEEIRIKEVANIKPIFHFDPRDQEWVYPFSEFRERFLYFVEE
ncbi:MAG: hypothetical protein AAF960_05795 [Bacteroidota bacterium]